MNGAHTLCKFGCLMHEKKTRMVSLSVVVKSMAPCAPHFRHSDIARGSRCDYWFYATTHFPTQHTHTHPHCRNTFVVRRCGRRVHTSHRSGDRSWRHNCACMRENSERVENYTRARNERTGWLAGVWGCCVCCRRV